MRAWRTPPQGLEVQATRTGIRKLVIKGNKNTLGILVATAVGRQSGNSLRPSARTGNPAPNQYPPPVLQARAAVSLDQPRRCRSRARGPLMGKAAYCPGTQPVWEPGVGKFS